ncbi:hypothetical protein FE257_004651 [Aspergillus nanangensis]|uniref:DEAD/DEAH box helicase n=1 Tax=Aspergillus nanangensis TaxID=2582783 RepID=A0AAD4D069_ASPNN|nr:hypothetical protein FE257_004651 [Aspergillus nanangensis]
MIRLRNLGPLPFHRVPRRPLLSSRDLWKPSLIPSCTPRRLDSTFAPDLPPPGLRPPPIVLRQYQEECIQAVLQYIAQGHKRLGISLATGAGKTVIFTKLIERISPRHENGHKTLILVHRRELVQQAAEHCRHAYPNSIVGIEMGNQRAPDSADIVVASIQSITRTDRLFRFNPANYKLVLVDEAHHVVARTYNHVLEHFGLDEGHKNNFDPNTPLLVGVSATFSRADGVSLGAAIDHIVYHKDYVDMIGERWLANAVFTTVKSGADLAGVRKESKAGDFVISSLSKAVNTAPINEITVRAWLANAYAIDKPRKSTLVFCVDIAHTRELADSFRKAGIDARYATSKTTQEARDNLIQTFKKGEFPVLLNCGLFTEGTDIPNVDCVLLARPTRSNNLLIQMIGRGLRLHTGKKDCHIIDMVATLSTGVLSTPTLFGLHPNEVLDKATGEELKQRKHAEDLTPTSDPDTHQPDLDSEDLDINLTFTKYDTIYDLLLDLKSDKHIRSFSPNAWVRVGENKHVLSGATGWLTVEKTHPSSSPIVDPNQGPAPWSVHHVTSFKSPTTEALQYTRPRLIASAPELESAVRAADTFAATEFEERYITTRKGWRRNPATTAQVAFLNKARIRDGRIQSTNMTRGQAADLITKLKFGAKSRFKKAMAKRLRAEEPSELEKLKMKTEVKVGPVKVVSNTRRQRQTSSIN